ncbi:MAG: prepilin-type N-terminal cleavage/methylation domain-containing protein [Myxococcota bacterium]|nr:type II secretion system protein GspH [Deltaproteobacteria bacterium]MCP4239146.1 prepilin-type N-terminal cleavage/methylation domain-containing protein [bacterium]MDP6074655.1 prepilin-type N-terminal cleavage/methylation domain-containing protein [Myxococcota bacterium]MDP6241959.1 prepilin-type N-terminal cleavage/methylation domain-containing protein [Myxococcota bacterium]MDP7072991.1 prepilin-type N-terminal cleavage/methylation domain-containing protein [Myxococcota bacterium]
MRRARLSQAAFTLIEMMAVLLIFAGVAAIFAPQVGSITGRSLQHRAAEMASQLELARQRAILTGVPHRVLLDLEGAGYRIEWWTTDPEEEDTEAEAPLDLRGLTPLPLEPSTRAARDWYPMPGTSGRFVWLDEELSITGVETTGDWIETGDVPIEFDWNGTTVPAAVHLDDESGRRLMLTIMPLAEGVRITDEG